MTLAQLDAQLRRRASADPLERIMTHRLTAEAVDEMADTRVLAGIIGEAQMGVWAAPAGAGKTAIQGHCAEILAKTHRVIIFQEDASPGDLIRMHDHAQQHGYTIVCSGLAGQSPGGMLAILEDYVQERVCLQNVILFFDTLKKFTDLLDKRGVRGFMILLRALTQLGATVVMLSHTNKHRGVDGKLIFEGTGDVRNDVDNLSYIEATERDSNGCIQATITHDKLRAQLVDASFKIDTRAMTIERLSKPIDVQSIERVRRQKGEDAHLIACVNGLLGSQGMPFTDLRKKLQSACGIGMHAARSLIERHLSADLKDEHALWIETRFRLNNTRHVSIKPSGGGCTTEQHEQPEQPEQGEQPEQPTNARVEVNPLPNVH